MGSNLARRTSARVEFSGVLGPKLTLMASHPVAMHNSKTVIVICTTVLGYRAAACGKVSLATKLGYPKRYTWLAEVPLMVQFQS